MADTAPLPTPPTPRTPPGSLSRPTSARAVPSNFPGASRGEGTVRFRVDVPEPVASRFELEADQSGRSVEQVLAAHLTAYAHLATTEPTLTISQVDRDTLSRTLGGRTLKDPADLVSRVTRLAQVKLGSVEIPLTQSQLDRLKALADKRGTSPEKELRHLVTRLVDQFGDLLG